MSDAPTKQQLQEWRDRHDLGGMNMTDLRCAYEDAASEATLSLRTQLKDMTDQFFAVSGQLGEAQGLLREFHIGEPAFDPCKLRERPDNETVFAAVKIGTLKRITAFLDSHLAQHDSPGAGMKGEK